MMYTPSFFHDGLPEWKRKKDPILSRLFYRPVSYVLSALFASAGITANAISYFSMLVAIAACAFFAVGKPVCGAVLVNVWLLLDCADGNIARCVRAERYGEFADALSSYVCVGLMFPCIGYCAYHTGGLFVPAGEPLIILMGALASGCDTLMRLGYQKFQVVGFSMGVNSHVDQNPEKTGGIDAIRIKVDAYLSLGGFLPAVLLIAAVASFLDVIVIIWAVYYGAVFVASTAYLIGKTVESNHRAQ